MASSPIPVVLCLSIALWVTQGGKLPEQYHKNAKGEAAIVLTHRDQEVSVEGMIDSLVAEINASGDNEEPVGGLEEVIGEGEKSAGEFEIAEGAFGVDQEGDAFEEENEYKEDKRKDGVYEMLGSGDGSNFEEENSHGEDEKYKEEKWESGYQFGGGDEEYFAKADDDYVQEVLKAKSDEEEIPYGRADYEPQDEEFDGTYDSANLAEGLTGEEVELEDLQAHDKINEDLMYAVETIKNILDNVV